MVFRYPRSSVSCLVLEEFVRLREELGAERKSIFQIGLGGKTKSELDKFIKKVRGFEPKAFSRPTSDLTLF